jgi:hypothetical protein
MNGASEAMGCLLVIDPFRGRLIHTGFGLAFGCAILAKGARPVAATGSLAGRQE